MLRYTLSTLTLRSSLDLANSFPLLLRLDIFHRSFPAFALRLCSRRLTLNRASTARLLPLYSPSLSSLCVSAYRCISPALIRHSAFHLSRLHSTFTTTYCSQLCSARYCIDFVRCRRGDSPQPAHTSSLSVPFSAEYFTLSMLTFSIEPGYTEFLSANTSTVALPAEGSAC